VECAFLNTYQARWQYTADAIGLGFAQGKTMLWRKSDLDSVGGIVALSRDLAEDAAATKIVQSIGKRVRVAAPSFHQPLGERSRVAVLARQQRWAQLRRLTFPVFFIPEILTGSVLPILCGSAAASLAGGSALLAAAVLLLIWFASEALLARRAGWSLGWRSPFAWIVRDLLLPYIWFKAWMSSGYEWQGNRIEVSPKRTAKIARTEMPA
jgi:ceramide glucosyltransferase